VELVFAVAALHGGKGPIGRVLHAVANSALFHAFSLLVNVALPLQDGRNDVTIARLDQVADAQGPFTNLVRSKFELVTDVDFNRLERVV